jgi:hypothetical protein
MLRDNQGHPRGARATHPYHVAYVTYKRTSQSVATLWARRGDALVFGKNYPEKGLERGRVPTKSPGHATRAFALMNFIYSFRRD